MNNEFRTLFETYGYAVEQLTESSYIADNGIYCVPYTEFQNSPRGSHYMCGVSFLSEEKDKIMGFYRKEKEYYRACKSSMKVEIGFEVWNAYANNRLSRYNLYPCGGIANHDHSEYEIETILQRRTA